MAPILLSSEGIDIMIDSTELINKINVNIDIRDIVSNYCYTLYVVIISYIKSLSKSLNTTKH